MRKQGLRGHLLGHPCKCHDELDGIHMSVSLASI